MLILRGKSKYDKQMDNECVELCNAINSLPGLKTIESCCGHGKTPYHIYFNVIDSMVGLFFLTRCHDKRYWKYGKDWSITLSVSDISYNDVLPTTFLLSSTATGEEAYKQALDLVINMNDHLNHKNFIKLYGIDLSLFKTKNIKENK